ncbi:CDP-alcohol phosphatidyltransferase family protein [Nocardioides marmoraquaticus]
MSFSETVARLGAAQKGRARGAPAYSVFVNRPIGRYLAAASHLLGLTPNQVTAVSAAFTLLGIVMVALAPATLVTGVAIWLLLALGYAWDSADGQVARLRGGGSVAGEWLDHFVDSGKVIGLHLAVVIGLYRHGTEPVYLLVPLLFALVNGMTFFGMILNDLLKGARGVASAARRGGFSPIRSLALLPTDYGVLCASFVLWGWATAFQVSYGLLCVAGVAFLVLAAVKWFREVTRLVPPTASSTTGT